MASALRRRGLALLWLCALAATIGIATAKEAAPAAADPALEARMQRIAVELRCLVCQNQTVADSHAGLAEDLRREIREQLQRGASDEQVMKYMTDRYGDFVLYRPPLKGSTLALWIGPAVLLAGGLLALVLVLRRRARLAPDRFEPDAPDSSAPDDTRGDAVAPR
ncbi:MAG: cytochrome c-type biogenesis protein CcmH [Ideonella sp.]|nr:cytochrome c-type biogenesis protein CcmH [Ideonella sp.]MCC7456118.1 cytochrome c-type biogenesis protein CcmH [Nitrospira sp.]